MVRSEQSNVKVKHSSPTFEYKFELAGETIEMPDDHADIICRNPDFEIVGASDDIKEDDMFFNDLCDIKGIGAKTAKDICDLYKDKNVLISMLKQGKLKGLRDDVPGILKKHYGVE
jgi:hypothetical protein